MDINWDAFVERTIESPLVNDALSQLEDQLLETQSENVEMFRGVVIELLDRAAPLANIDRRIPAKVRQELTEEFRSRVGQRSFRRLERNFARLGWGTAIIRAEANAIADAALRVIERLFVLGTRELPSLQETAVYEVVLGELGQSLAERYPTAVALGSWSRTQGAVTAHLVLVVSTALKVKGFASLISRIAMNELQNLDLDDVAETLVAHSRRVGAFTPLAARRAVREAFAPQVELIQLSIQGMPTTWLAEVRRLVADEMFDLLWDRIRSRCVDG